MTRDLHHIISVMCQSLLYNCSLIKLEVLIVSSLLYTSYTLSCTICKIEPCAGAMP